MTLNFETRGHITHVFPWAHVGGYHRVHHGGVSGFSFSELHHWPIHYRPEAAPPPKKDVWWEFNPCVYRNAVDGAYYDDVLVRGDVNPFAYEPPGPVFRAVARSRDFTLYEKDETARWPERGPIDEGPCSPKSVPPERALGY